MKELPIVVKADVQGSAEAVKQSLETLSNDEVDVYKRQVLGRKSVPRHPGGGSDGKAVGTHL